MAKRSFCCVRSSTGRSLSDLPKEDTIGVLGPNLRTGVCYRGRVMGMTAHSPPVWGRKDLVNTPESWHTRCCPCQSIADSPCLETPLVFSTMISSTCLFRRMACSGTISMHTDLIDLGEVQPSCAVLPVSQLPQQAFAALVAPRLPA